LDVVNRKPYTRNPKPWSAIGVVQADVNPKQKLGALNSKP